MTITTLSNTIVRPGLCATRLFGVSSTGYGRIFSYSNRDFNLLFSRTLSSDSHPNETRKKISFKAVLAVLAVGTITTALISQNKLTNSKVNLEFLEKQTFGRAKERAEVKKLFGDPATRRELAKFLALRNETSSPYTVFPQIRVMYHLRASEEFSDKAVAQFALDIVQYILGMKGNSHEMNKVTHEQMKMDLMHKVTLFKQI